MSLRWYHSSGLSVMSSGARLACQHRREQDAVVVDVRLVAEDGDVEAALVLEDRLDARHARHAVADNDQVRHGWYPGA